MNNNAEKLRDGELDWFRKLLLKRREIEQHESSSGDALASGADLAETSNKISALQNEAKAIEYALASIRKQRASAILAEFQDQAVSIRRQAAAHRAERELLLKKTSKSLRELSQLEGVEYDVSILAAQRNGLWSNLTNTRIDVDSMSPFEAMHSSPNLAPFKKPKSRALLDEAIRLEDEAESLMQRKVPDSGTCEGASLEELLAEAYRDALRVGPPPLGIAEWVNTKEAAFEKSSPGLEIRKRRFQISWRDAEFLPIQSSAEFTGEPRAELVA